MCVSKERSAGWDEIESEVHSTKESMAFLTPMHLSFTKTLLVAGVLVDLRRS